jgi:hypothetical protein
MCTQDAANQRRSRAVRAAAPPLAGPNPWRSRGMIALTAPVLQLLSCWVLVLTQSPCFCAVMYDQHHLIARRALRYELCMRTAHSRPGCWVTAFWVTACCVMAAQPTAERISATQWFGCRRTSFVAATAVAPFIPLVFRWLSFPHDVQLSHRGCSLALRASGECSTPRGWQRSERERVRVSWEETNHFFFSENSHFFSEP